MEMCSREGRGQPTVFSAILLKNVTIGLNYISNLIVLLDEQSGSMQLISRGTEMSVPNFTPVHLLFVKISDNAIPKTTLQMLLSSRSIFHLSWTIMTLECSFLLFLVLNL